MRFDLPIMQLDNVSRDNRLIPVECEISLVGTGAPVLVEVSGGLDVECIGVIDMLHRKGDAIMAQGEIWHSEDVYNNLMSGERALSCNVHVGRSKLNENRIMIMESLTLMSALVVWKAGWAWAGSA